MHNDKAKLPYFVQILFVVLGLSGIFVPGYPSGI